MHVVTGLVKLFLRELPEPLLMTKYGEYIVSILKIDRRRYYPHLMACVNIEVAEQQRAAVGEIVQTLPASHLHLLMDLLTVCRIIAANAECALQPQPWV